MNVPPTSPLIAKLHTVAQSGFDQIELGFPDLVSFASSHHGRDVAEDDWEALCSVGEEVKRVCREVGLGVLMLQPFGNFEGWPEESQGREAVWKRTEGWVRVMWAVGTDMLQVGATDTPSPPLLSKQACAQDLARLADLLAPHSYRICYED